MLAPNPGHGIQVGMLFTPTLLFIYLWWREGTLINTRIIVSHGKLEIKNEVVVGGRRCSYRMVRACAQNIASTGNTRVQYNGTITWREDANKR